MVTAVLVTDGVVENVMVQHVHIDIVLRINR